MSCISLLSEYGKGPNEGPERQFRFTCTEGPKTYQSLHLAVSMKKMDIVTLLLKNGADVNGMDRRGATPLQFAAARGDLKMIRELVNQGAYIHSRDHEFETPILAAARENELDTVKLLHELGASLEDRDCWGIGTLYHSRYSSTETSPLMDWIMENSDWKAWKCRDGGAILHHSMTPRAFEGCPLMLIQRGADILQSCAYYGYPIHCALWHAKDSVATEILRLTPPDRLKDVLDFQSTQFGTALYTAASRFGSAKLVEQVLNAGASINLADNEQGTALNIACVNGDLATVKVLLSRGALVYTTNSKGETKSALEIARRPTSRKCPQIVKLLEKYQAEQAEERGRNLAALAAQTGWNAANAPQSGLCTPSTPETSSQESDIALVEKSELLDLQ
jgi:ankyrin repeat protein